MAENFFLISLLFIAVASCRSTYQTARRVEQSLVDRSTYLGGWPLAAVPCPSDASVACDTGISSQINQQCCPSGNTCFSWPATIPPVCCPSCMFLFISSIIMLFNSLSLDSLCQPRIASDNFKTSPFARIALGICMSSSPSEAPTISVASKVRLESFQQLAMLESVRHKARLSLHRFLQRWYVTSHAQFAGGMR